MRGRDANLSEWSVGGRSFGTLLVWVLLAGECYTSFSYLGAAGWAYGYGAPIFYLVGYMATGYVTVYLFAPMVWGYAKRHGLISISDIIAHRFRSRKFGAFVAIIATIALLPYIQLQIQGMGLVVNAISYNEIGLKTAFVIAFVVSVGFVLISGLRGSAWVSVLKDALVILTIAFLAVYLPLKLFGSYGELFGRLRTERPEWLTLPGQRVARPGRAVVRLDLHPQRRRVHRLPELRRRLPGLEVGQHDPPQRDLPADVLAAAAGADDARHGRAVRRPQPRHATTSRCWRWSRASCPGWVVGIIGVAGALSAIVPMAVFMLCIGTMWGKSVIGLGGDDPARHKRLSQIVVVASGLVALGGALAFPDALVRLSVLSYEGVAQLVPAVVGGLLWRRMTVAGAASGHRRRLGDRVPARALRQRPVPGHQRRPDRPRRQRARQRDDQPGAA